MGREALVTSGGVQGLLLAGPGHYMGCKRSMHVLPVQGKCPTSALPLRPLTGDLLVKIIFLPVEFLMKLRIEAVYIDKKAIEVIGANLASEANVE